jgi:hypothetical protein
MTQYRWGGSIIVVNSISNENVFRILYSFLNRKARLNSHNKLLLFKRGIRSILCYGVEIGFHCANTHKKKLRIIQNKCKKKNMNHHWRYSTSTLHEETNILLIGEFVLFIQTPVNTQIYKCYFNEK